VTRGSRIAVNASSNTASSAAIATCCRNVSHMVRLVCQEW
jgi:hypothetical protein